MMNTTTFDLATHLKNLGTALVAILTGFYGPMLPYIGITTLLVLLDFVTACTLGVRLRRRGMDNDPRLSSRKFGHLVATLTRIFAAFTVAALLQAYILPGYIEGVDAVRLLAGAICFRQIMSILENESTATDSTWARQARKYLADKTKRHLNPD